MPRRRTDHRRRLLDIQQRNQLLEGPLAFARDDEIDLSLFERFARQRSRVRPVECRKNPRVHLLDRRAQPEGPVDGRRDHRQPDQLRFERTQLTLQLVCGERGH